MKPFTLRQAKVLCKDLQTLVGTHFDAGHQGGRKVACVALAPFDDINKWIFVSNYLSYQDAEVALDYYNGPFFDVLVIAEISKELNKDDYYDARTFMAMHAIPYDTAGYEHA